MPLIHTMLLGKKIKSVCVDNSSHRTMFVKRRRRMARLKAGGSGEEGERDEEEEEPKEGTTYCNHSHVQSDTCY